MKFFSAALAKMLLKVVDYFLKRIDGNRGNMDINELHNLAKQLKVDSVFFVPDELDDNFLSEPEYISKQKISIVWRAGDNCLTVRAWNVSESGYNDERIMQVGLTQKYRTSIKDKILKQALLSKFKVEDHDELDFDYEDFIYPLNVECLCRTIKDDFPQLELAHGDNTINILNQVLRTPDFFRRVRDFNPGIFSLKSIIDLIEKVEPYSEKTYGEIPEEERKLLRKLNRLLLKKTYPSKVPAKKYSSKDSIDAHHHEIFIDSFEQEFSYRSNIAEFKWLYRSDVRAIGFSIRNLSKKTIPISNRDIVLIDVNENIYECENIWEPPDGWISPASDFDLYKGITAKIIFRFPRLNLEETKIKRFIYRQNFYTHGDWYSVFSIFDFQLKGTSDAI